MENIYKCITKLWCIKATKDPEFLKLDFSKSITSPVFAGVKQKLYECNTVSLTVYNAQTLSSYKFLSRQNPFPFSLRMHRFTGRESIPPRSLTSRRTRRATKKLRHTPTTSRTSVWPIHHTPLRNPTPSEFSCLKLAPFPEKRLGVGTRY